MNKVLSAIGKKNIIIISGVLLVGIAIYLNLNLSFTEDYILDERWDDSRALGQATLVDNLNVLPPHPEDAGIFEPEEHELAEPADNYFAITVVSRQRARDETIELLSSIVDNAEDMPEVRGRALNDIADIAREIEREANIETLLRAKGFAECVAVVSGENANIIVRTDGLMPNEIVQIKEIVFEQAGIHPRNIKIIERH